MATRKTSDSSKAAKPRAPRKPRVPKTSVEASHATTQELEVRKAPAPSTTVTKDENGVPGLILKAFVALILVLFYYFGYIHHPSDPGPNLWSNLHPTTGADIIGTLLFTGAALAIGGFFGRTLAAAKWYPLAVGIAGVIGIILIFA